MKTCPQCSQVYSDETLNFCLSDGTLLGSDNLVEQETVVLSHPLSTSSAKPSKSGVSPIFAYLFIGLIALIAGAGLVMWLKPEPSLVRDQVSTPNAAVPQASSLTPQLNTVPANNSVQTRSSTVVQPFTDYRTKGVRVGTADGKRLRVVLDLTPPSQNSSSAKFQTVDSSGGLNTTRVSVEAILVNENVRYESKATQGLASIRLQGNGNSTEIIVEPRRSLFLRDVFVIPASRGNANERLVIDLCINQGCPSLKP